MSAAEIKKEPANRDLRISKGGWLRSGMVRLRDPLALLGCRLLFVDGEGLEPGHGRLQLVHLPREVVAVQVVGGIADAGEESPRDGRLTAHEAGTVLPLEDLVHRLRGGHSPQLTLHVDHRQLSSSFSFWGGLRGLLAFRLFSSL